MQVSIIGAGNVGTALATTLTRAGHDVTVAAPHTEHARAVAEATGARTAPTTGDAARAANIVILAVPATAHEALAKEVAGALDGKIVIDVANRPTPDPNGAPTSIGEELQQILPDAHVVKAFNTLFASRQADPHTAAGPAAAFVAGDDADAKNRVVALLDSAGFRSIDAGPLAAARTLEGMAWLNISRNMNGGTWQDAWQLVGPGEDA
jgi:8-hydroxy-5-deazaflavin:NADPH oxidoreductase